MINTWIIPIAAVADSTGVLTQLFPPWCPAGADPATATPGDQLRKPCEGFMRSAQIMTDGTNGGTIELWDVNGFDLGLDMSTTTAITAAQLTALIALGKAQQIWAMRFTSTAGASTPNIFGKQFVHGLAARYINAGAAGTCTINADVEGGFRLLDTAGL